VQQTTEAAMGESPAQDAEHMVAGHAFDRGHYRELRRRNIIRLTLTYLAPLILLTGYFYFQYGAVVAEGRRLHLKAIAENQANTLDLFLRERLVNLSNVIDDPKFTIPPSPVAIQNYLIKLQNSSSAFVDIGFFDSSGIQVSYAGPYNDLERRNYASEPWYKSLRSAPDSFLITDIYLGFRQKPHFTIAVRRTIAGRFVALRATLAPEEIYQYIRSLEGSAEVYISIVNPEGYYQLVTPHVGTLLETSAFVPPKEPQMNASDVRIDGRSLSYAYSWLRNAEWALIVQWSAESRAAGVSGFQWQIFGIAAVLILVSLAIILQRAHSVATFQMESDATRAQLEHAAKLASVGELAAGIAHEINNPLAAISEEAGLTRDLIDPSYAESADTEELMAHLDSIQESVFRCRDITRKLLGFVRSDSVELKPHDIRELIDSVVDGFLVRELAAANITIERDYGDTIPPLLTDTNQLQQVLLNILNNAVDAIGDRAGKIGITTIRDGNEARIAVTDSGAGMTEAQLSKVFLPFYTTKEVGKGTGLGLSVSYGIVKNLGGRIEAESRLGRGSRFTIVLPILTEQSVRRQSD
jgi:two-component system NtrC family sensor kinase